MDYDRTAIAKTYDAARGYSPEVLRLWLELVAAAAPRDVALIVDVGCGTGRFSRPLAERFDTRVIGIDPSQNMLEIAGNKAKERNVDCRGRRRGGAAARWMRGRGLHVDDFASFGGSRASRAGMPPPAAPGRVPVRAQQHARFALSAAAVFPWHRRDDRAGTAVAG